MQRESSIQGSPREVPHDDVSPEPHVGLLAGSQEVSRWGTAQARDSVGVSGENVLLVGREVFHDHLAPQGVDDVFSFWVAYQAIWNTP